MVENGSWREVEGVKGIEVEEKRKGKRRNMGKQLTGDSLRERNIGEDLDLNLALGERGVKWWVRVCFPSLYFLNQIFHYVTDSVVNRCRSRNGNRHAWPMQWPGSGHVRCHLLFVPRRPER